MVWYHVLVFHLKKGKEKKRHKQAKIKDKRLAQQYPSVIMPIFASDIDTSLIARLLSVSWPDRWVR